MVYRTKFLNDSFIDAFYKDYLDMEIQHEDDQETFKDERKEIFESIDNEDDIEETEDYLESEIAALRGSLMTYEFDINWNPIEEKTNDEKRELLRAITIFFDKTNEELKQEFMDTLMSKLGTEVEEGKAIFLQRANDYIDELLLLEFNNKFKLGGIK